MGQTPFSLSVGWLSPDASINKYLLQYKKRNANVDWSEVIVNSANHATSYVIENLEPFTDYDIRVSSVNERGIRSQPTDILWAKTPKGEGTCIGELDIWVVLEVFVMVILQFGVVVKYNLPPVCQKHP